MKKNIIIAALAIIALAAVWSTVFFYNQANKLKEQNNVLQRNLSEVRKESRPEVPNKRIVMEIKQLRSL